MLDILTSLVEFLVFTVVVKGIIAHALAEYFLKYAKMLSDKNPRYKVAVRHELDKHKASLEHCYDGKCSTL